MIQAREAAAEGHVRRARRLGRLGGLAAVAVAAAPFAGLWVLSMATADDPLTFRLRLDMAVGFVLATRLGLLGTPGWEEGVMGYLFTAPLLVVLGGSALAAAAARSFRSGVWAAAWAVLLAAPLVIAGWLIEAVAWHQRGLGLLLDGEGGRGVGANLGDAVWWPLIFLALWTLPVGVLGAAAGRFARSVRQRSMQR